MEQQQEWQPKWGVGDKCMVKSCPIVYSILSINNGYAWLYGDDGHITCDISILLPPKPKTLREEIWDWLKQEDCSLSCDSRIKLSHIIDRHEKGATNE